MKKFTVFSAFDGIGGGRIALDKLGIPIETYYASEIEKNAIEIMRYNYPDTVHVGDILNINFDEYKGKVDLLIGGSPCQDLSIAKNFREGLKGKKSGLFFKFVEALNTMQPKYFLLENVASMKDSERDTITELLGVKPIMINSSLVSAQNRRRYYWTNIPNVSQPEDKGTLLKDILLEGYGVGVELQGKVVKKLQDKANSLMARDYKGFGNQQMTGVMVPTTDETPIKGRKLYEIKDGVCSIKNEDNENEPTNINLPDGLYSLRKLDPIECERLQTLPDNYTAFGLSEDGKVAKISNTQRYKAIGNGWTTDVIAHIFKGLKEE